MITLEEAMKNRCSVRRYSEKSLGGEIKKELLMMIDEINSGGDLNFQLVCDEPKAFDSFMAHYGKFSGVRNYIALIGKKSPRLEEKCGYYGEKIVLRAQQLGLNTCWVAMSYKKIKTAFTVKRGEKLCLVIAIGYGAETKSQHKSKSVSEVSRISGDMPDWFKKGIEAALTAPTAMNQQKFTFSLENGIVCAKPGKGFYTKTDLGIAEYHFELAAGKEHFTPGF